MLKDEVAYGNKSTHDPYELESADDLANSDATVRFIVDDMVPFGQCGIIAAVEKCLKTTIGLDLAVSVASGQPFLNHFSVLDAGRVGFWCGESGRPTIKETLNRICTEKGLGLRDIGDRLRIGYAVPSLKKNISVLRDFVEREQPKLVLLDPLNFGLRDVAGDMANAIAVSAVLSPLNEICQESGCSFIAIAHNRRPSKDKYQPRSKAATLEDVAFAGIGAWARFWMCLGKRRDFVQQTGDHRLWMNVGGSVGHASTFGLDVHEGNRADHGGRVWTVKVKSEAEIRDHEEERRTSGKNATLERNAARALVVIRASPGGLSQSGVATAARMNSEVARNAIKHLVDNGTVAPEKCGRTIYFVATSAARAA